MQMMKTTARTGPTTQIRPSPASNGCGSESGAITRSVYGLATYIFCKKKRKRKNTTEEDDHKIVDRQSQKRAFYFLCFTLVYREHLRLNSNLMHSLSLWITAAGVD